MRNPKKEKLYLILILIVALAIACVLIVGLTQRDASRKLSVPPKPAEPVVRVEVREVEKQVEKIVEVEKTITSEMLQDGLNDMGLLITEEYYFTDVIHFSSTLKEPIFHTNVKLTESEFLVSYDGVVTAGIDFSSIAVEKDEENLTITVKLPKAEIRNVDIDPESFEMYSEKSSVFNPLSIEDFNNAHIELESNARQKALEKGVLARADENAQSVVSNFIRSLVDTSVYSVKFVTV